MPVTERGKDLPRYNAPFSDEIMEVREQIERLRALGCDEEADELEMDLQDAMDHPPTAPQLTPAALGVKEEDGL